MSGGELLIAGKAVLWFAIPLAAAAWDLRSLARERRRREAARRTAAGGGPEKTSR
jgi:hypothetical protein